MRKSRLCRLWALNVTLPKNMKLNRFRCCETMRYRFEVESAKWAIVDGRHSRIPARAHFLVMTIQWFVTGTPRVLTRESKVLLWSSTIKSYSMIAMIAILSYSSLCCRQLPPLQALGVTLWLMTDLLSWLDLKLFSPLNPPCFVSVAIVDSECCGPFWMLALVVLVASLLSTSF